MRRICDPHESWYLGQATKAGLIYICPKKDGRKDTMIKNLQTALSSGKIKIAPWCHRLLEELEGAYWSEAESGRTRIVGGHRLHSADCSQYFVDLMPTRLKEQIGLPWHEELRRADHAIKEARATKSSSKVKRKRWIVR